MTTVKGLDADTLEMMLGAIRSFCEAHLPNEKLLELDHADECPVDIVRKALDPEQLGVHLPFVPEEFNGMGGSTFDVYRICELMAGIDLGVATSVFAIFLGADPIVVGATPEQRKYWMTRIADEGMIFAYGATEPEAGSDLGALKTKATPVEQDGQVVGYRINGRKQWISNGGIADACTILANAPGGPSWFVVDGGTEGLTAGKPEDKHGIRLSNTAALWLDDLYVDSERLVGGVEGQGLIQAQKVFGYTRLMVAAFGLGVGWAALDVAIPYSTERRVGGSPLSEKQGYTHKLIVPNAARLEAGRAYIEETAERIDAEEGFLNTEGAVAKYLSTEAGNRAAEDAIQALGGYGYTKEYMVEKHKRDVKITTIYEGTSEIMEMTIARDRWQEHLKTRGGYYHDEARKMEALHARLPAAGADVSALALHALAEVLEAARLARLTRSQHVLFRLGELIAYAEGAAALARRVGRMVDGSINPKADIRFDADGLGAVSRVFARETAMKVVAEGLRWVQAADDTGLDLGALEARMNVSAIRRAQSGGVADMDRVAQALYARIS